MKSRTQLQREVMRCANQRCEYCRMHQSLQGAAFHMEHVTPTSKGGATESGNLAWACPGCNLRKSDRTAAVDPETGAEVEFFHPRRHLWNEHLIWDGDRILGNTPIGRAVVAALDLNHDRRVMIRQVESAFGLFPPDDDKLTSS